FLVNLNPRYTNLTQLLKVSLEMDEMWGRVYCKKTPCWLWHAINHKTGEIIAYVFGTHEHEVLQKLSDLLSKLKIETEAVFSDDNIAYHEAIPANILFTGKRNTQRIERKHLTFRTRLKRLARKTICYSKSLDMHKIVFGLLISALEFGNKLV
ncbi:MAG: IS1 family transposase, partial [Nitrososphaerota archaeon]|nr:IS1 family transposase [Nitrososphaerota archaeon]